MSVFYESIIKVNPTDDPDKRARDIVEGIGYACALLMDEYHYNAEEISDVLERAIDAVQDEEAHREEADG
jgi:hypothetical protein